MTAARRIVVECGAPRARSYGAGWAVVAVDVFRATTTACTAVAGGRRCLPVATVEQARKLASRLDAPLLAGEQRGEAVTGFDLGNSPSAISMRDDVERPLVLVTTCGTPLLVGAPRASAVYAACLRNASSQARQLLDIDLDVAVIGAGTLGGDFRVEDQLGCARIASDLVAAGYQADKATREHVDRWANATATVATTGPSAAFLRRCGQQCDVEFVLEHQDDLAAVFPLVDGELWMKAV